MDVQTIQVEHQKVHQTMMGMAYQIILILVTVNLKLIMDF
jgi:predicted nucleic acid-binding Zn ribbon protein